MKKNAAVLSKKALIGIILFVCAAAAVLLAVLFAGRKTGYRDILVFEAATDATVYRNGDNLSVYEGMKLQNEDTVKVTGDGFLRLLLDQDKYITLEPGTEIYLTATGNSSNSNTEIQLISGSVLNEIDSKLSSGSTYEVTTPVSVMAVRGTAFYVSAEKDDSDIYTVELAVLDGTVSTKAAGKDETEVFVEAGMSARIQGSENDAGVISANEPIDYSLLPANVLERIAERKETGDWEQLPAATDEIKDILAAAGTGKKPDPTETEETKSKQETASETHTASETGVSEMKASETLSAPADQKPSGSKISADKASVPAVSAKTSETSETPSPDSDNTVTDPDPAPDSKTTDTNSPTSAAGSRPNDMESAELLPYFTVTFTSADGTVFATQTVKGGACASCPALVPTGGSNWYLEDTIYDFTTPVTADLIISYK